MHVPFLDLGWGSIWQFAAGSAISFEFHEQNSRKIALNEAKIQI